MTAATQNRTLPFSGHGSAAGQIVLQDESGDSQPVPVQGLKELFELLKGDISCVVLNSCYSRRQAEAIAENIPCVVGMSGTIGDDAAIAFAASFYQALGYGKSIKAASAGSDPFEHLLGTQCA